MSKLPFIIAVGSAALLVSCEPLPPNPPPGYRPYPRNFPRVGENEQFQRDRDGRYEEGYRREEGYGRDERYGPDGREQVPPPVREEYPTAERTANPNEVLSPYKPYNVINIEGFRSGQLAKDPSNQKIFRVP